jgi:hypothetical protein
VIATALRTTRLRNSRKCSSNGMRPAGVVDIGIKRRLVRLGLASSHLSYLTFQI